MVLTSLPHTIVNHSDNARRRAVDVGKRELASALSRELARNFS